MKQDLLTNERIKQFAEQSGLAKAADVRGGYIYPEGMEKFAKLIVQACAEELRDTEREAERAYKAREIKEPNTFNGYDCADLLEERFGVEEHKGWVCPYCGTDRTRKPCPQGDMAAVEGRCPMIGVAQ